MAGPVIGNLIVRFGDPLENGPSNGITIDTVEDVHVYSIYAGKVIFAGYKNGYGNMVIIDHDLQYYTITARLDEIHIKEGDRVQTRQQIGTTGDIATLFSKGLYFEVRQGSEPLDPLDWLQENYYPQQIPLPLPSGLPHRKVIPSGKRHLASGITFPQLSDLELCNVSTTCYNSNNCYSRLEKSNSVYYTRTLYLQQHDNMYSQFSQQCIHPCFDDSHEKFSLFSSCSVLYPSGFPLCRGYG